MSGPPRRARVVVADDHPIVLSGLQTLLALEQDLEVVACCQEGEEALRVVLERRPDLLILDLRMPQIDGLAILAALRRERVPTRVLLLTAAIETRQIVEALRLGARGLVLKEMAPEVVVQAARRILEGGQWFDSGLLARAAEGLVTAGADTGESGTLTPREREIARRVAEGKRNRTIARELGITEGTVKLHLHHVYEKLGLSGRVELLLFAQRNGF